MRFSVLRDLGTLKKTRAEVLSHVLDRAAASKSGYLVTINLDHYRRLQSDASFRTLYADADSQTLDGTPLVWLRAALGAPGARVTGVDLALDVLNSGQVVPLIVGGAPGVAERAATVLRGKGLTASALDPGEVADPQSTARLIVEYARSKGCDLVLICLGSPKQELVAAAIARAGGPYALCVGAFVDFAAGTVVRAPGWAQRLGLEWIYRLMSEPTRLWQRYARCLAVLPKLVIQEWYVRRELSR